MKLYFALTIIYYQIINADNLTKNLIELKLSVGDYFKIKTDVFYDIIFLKFEENKIILSILHDRSLKPWKSLCPYSVMIKRNFILRVFDISNKNIEITTLVKEIGEEIFLHFEFSHYHKVFVYEQSDVILNEKAKKIIDLIIYNYYEKTRYFTHIVLYNSSAFFLILCSPINSESFHDFLPSSGEIFYIRKNNIVYTNYYYVTSQYSYIFEIDLDELKEYNLTMFVAPNKCLQYKKYNNFIINQIFYLSLLFYLSNYSNVITAIEMKALDELKVYNFYLLRTDDNLVDFHVYFKAESIFFKHNFCDFLFSIIKNSKCKDNSKTFLESKFPFFSNLLKRFLPKHVYTFNIEEVAFNEIKSLLKFINKYQSRDKKMIEQLFRLLQMNQVVENFVNKIIMRKNSGLKIFFINLCLNLNLCNITDFSNSNFQQVFSDYNIFTEDQVKRIVAAMIFTASPITYLMKLCIFFEIEKILNGNEKKNISLLYFFDVYSRFEIVKRKNDIEQEIKNVTINTDIYEIYEKFVSELKTNHLDVGKKWLSIHKNIMKEMLYIKMPKYVKSGNNNERKNLDSYFQF